MATLSFKEFSKGGAVSVVGNESQVQEQEAKTGASLMSKLGNRAKDLGSATLTFGTLGANTIDPNTPQADKGLATIGGLANAGVAPMKALGAVGGAVGDVVGAGLQATGLDKPIAEFLKPIAESGVAQKAVEAFNALPPEYQDYLKTGMEAGNLLGVGAGKSVVTGALKNIPTFKSVGEITNILPKNLSQKAIDLISSDPSAKVETILKRATPDELNNYLNIAKSSSVSGEAKTVLETVGDKLSDATKSLETKLGEIGKAKSDIILPLREGLGSFKVETQPFLDGLTKLRNSFSEVDKGNAAIVDAIIADAKTISTKIDADKFIDKIQDAIYSGNRNMTLVQGSAVDKQLRGLLGKYNSTLKASLPGEYSVLNKRYADMIDTLSVINRSLGEVVEGVPSRGAGLVKQYFSPAGSKTKEIFEFIKKETNGEVDLAKDVTLAKFAGQLYDDVNVNSLLGGIKDIPTTLGGAISKVVEKVGGDKVTNAMRESTIRKAKEISSPKSPTKSGSKTTNQLELKELLSSPKSTPVPPKSKGIRGMVNPSELVPKKKVVSEPVTVYHGTGIKFDTFDPSMKGSITGAKSAQGAIWFTDSPEVAKAYSFHAADTGVVTKALEDANKLEKIAQKSGKSSDWDAYDKAMIKAEELDTYDAQFNRRQFANVKEATIKGDFYEVDAKGKTPQELSKDDNIDSWLNEQISIAKKQGKDGVKIKNLDDAVGLYNKPSTHWAIFDTKNIQLKSKLSTLEQEAKKYKSADINNFLPEPVKSIKDVNDFVRKDEYRKSINSSVKSAEDKNYYVLTNQEVPISSIDIKGMNLESAKADNRVSRRSQATKSNILVKVNDNGTLSLVDGRHRLAGAITRKEKSIKIDIELQKNNPINKLTKSQLINLLNP